ncbi:dTDP-glucose 4,6-dehydratase [Parasphingorhabdus sp.]|uniref:dTDP-glucose 4,6-dehydratase n=1 Tax=Parasphingorhabdus sp. TaxID=2709688 RepID=UPI002B27385F|nr:dTDP-glucose 4,6-dehydratase [Parasphingorhabdus sp.]
MANLLVTGGAGFIGANFVRYWNSKNPSDTITVVDALTYAGNKQSLDGVEAELVVADICDHPAMTLLVKDYDIDTIVHFAAESHVDRSIDGPDAFLQTNIIGTHSLLKAAKENWLDGGGKAHRFHHVSTDEVYGSLGPDDQAFSETTAFKPNSPYSASKAASDHLVRAYHHTYGLKTTTSNCSNNYGPYQFPEKLIPLFLLNCLHGKSLPIYGDGKNVRDWLHVEDHCRGIDAVITKGRIGETYNIGGGQKLTNMSVIERICETVDTAFVQDSTLAGRYPNAPAAKGKRSDTLKTFVTDRKGHDRCYAIDETKARRRLGYQPSRTFEEGLAQTVEWYLQNEGWWQALITRKI